MEDATEIGRLIETTETDEEQIQAVVEEIVPELKGREERKPLGFLAAMKRVVGYWGDYWGRKWMKDKSRGEDSIESVNSAMAMLVSFGAVVGVIIQVLLNPEVPVIVGIGIAGAAAALLYGFLAVLILEVSLNIGSPQLERVTYYGLSPVCAAAGLIFLGLPGLGLGLIPFIPWVAQALYWMRRTRQEEWLTAELVPIPPMKEIQKRALSKARETIKETRKSVEGPDSQVERRVAELKAKVTKAKGIKRRLEVMLQDNPDNEKIRELINNVEETLKLFKKDFKKFRGEQRAVLNLFQEIEAFIPREETSIEIDSLTVELAELRGEAAVSRQVSRGIIQDAIRPIFNRLIPLEQARQRLLVHSSAALEGPGSLARFYSVAEQVGEDAAELDSKVRDIRSKLG